MKNGIKQIVDKRIAWPPNLPKFLELAGGLDTDEAFDRMIAHKKPRDDVEHKVWSECAFECRTRLAEDKARAKFKKVYIKWHERKQRGEMPNPNQKALPRVSVDRPTDRLVEERMRSNKPKTDLEKRIDALGSK